jgi:hypothetical protein
MVAPSLTLEEGERNRLLNALRDIWAITGGARNREAAEQPLLQPTVFVAHRPGEDIMWDDVVARRV